MSAHTQLGQSRFLLEKYLTALNTECPVLDEYRAKWTADDLIPGRIREYCKYDKSGARGICWSCIDYIKKYKDEIIKYEQGPGATLDLIRELQVKQAEMDGKLDRILALLSDRAELTSLKRVASGNNGEGVSGTD